MIKHLEVGGFLKLTKQPLCSCSKPSAFTSVVKLHYISLFPFKHMDLFLCPNHPELLVIELVYICIYLSIHIHPPGMNLTPRWWRVHSILQARVKMPHDLWTVDTVMSFCGVWHNTSETHFCSHGSPANLCVFYTEEQWFALIRFKACHLFKEWHCVGYDTVLPDAKQTWKPFWKDSKIQKWKFQRAGAGQAVY